ncbi:MAG: phospholipase D family protein [Pseudomonadota bacterium]
MIDASTFSQPVRGSREAQLRALGLAFLTLLLASCASLRIDPSQRPVSYAPVDTQNTALAEVIAPQASANPGLSGFLLLLDGAKALDARVQLCRVAEQSIDLQYYLWNRDRAGRELAAELVRAADRGVRVRILLDDIFEAGRDIEVARFSSHPNIEVRYFNPKKTRKRFAPLRQLTELAFRFGQINRRMHNKIFAVDNQMAILGGRNIGDEYFDQGEDFNFYDSEVVAVGPIVPQVSASFDDYWNSSSAYPVAALAGSRAVTSYEDLLSQGYFAAVTEDDPREILAESLPLFHWAPARLVVDDPGKVDDPKRYQSNVLPALRDLIRDTSDSVILQSAYFIPGKAGVEGLGQLVESGTKVTISTNSLASNNHAIAHSGYGKYRKALVRNGLELYELKPSQPERPGTWGIHSKVAVFDRRIAFVGTFNLDPRSAALNTEMALIIESPALAGQLADAIEEQLAAERSWRLTLDERNRLSWNSEHRGSEPEAGVGRRFSSFFLSLLPIENQL